MAQRTRRNLSDPRIRKIVRAQTNEWSKHSRSRYRNLPQEKKITPLMKVLLFLGLVAAGLAVLIYPNRPDLAGRPGETNSAPAETATDVQPLASPETPTLQKAEMPAALPEEQGTGASAGGISETVAPTPVSGTIQVEILNGCGVPGLAERLMKYLRQRGIDVVSTGNYVNFDVLTTKILDRSGHHGRAMKVAELIGLPPEHILLRTNKNLQLDATIVLGKDYRTLKFVKP